MRVLLLGASGFLGSHIADALNADSTMELISQSRADSGTNGHTVALDLATAGRQAVASLLAAVRPDAIINAAGTVIGSEEELVAANVTTVESRVAGLAQTGSVTRLVQLGSAAEYGATPAGDPIAEATPPNPITAYGRSKLAATQLILDAAQNDGIRAAVFRVFNPVGRGMSRHSLLGAAATQIRRALDHGSHEIALGSLDDYRDFVDARDIADAVHRFLSVPEDALQTAVINLGRGVAVQARDAVALLAAIAAYDGRLLETGPGSIRSARVPWQAANISRARTALRWEPQRTLEDSLVALWASLPRATKG